MKEIKIISYNKLSYKELVKFYNSYPSVDWAKRAKFKTAAKHYHPEIFRENDFNTTRKRKCACDMDGSLASAGIRPPQRGF